MRLDITAYRAIEVESAFQEMASKFELKWTTRPAANCRA